MARKKRKRSGAAGARKPGRPRASRSAPASLELSLWKKLLFSLLATGLFFGGLELVLAASGVRPQRYDQDPYVGFSSRVPHFTPRAGDGAVLETAASKLRLFNPQSFARHKADGTTRIFCLGGSTTYGRPYGDVTSFCGWLRELLPAADPGRSWEVVNAGGISYASYRVALLMEELIAYQPDLFLIYTGHNEFLERRTYGELLAVPRAVRGLGALASRTRIWSAGTSALERVRGGEPEPPGTVLEDDVRTLLDASVGPDAYHRDDDLREQVLSHYRFSLARMADMARSAGAGVIFVTPASNLRHASPFKSEHDAALDESGRARVAALHGQAGDALRSGRAAEALAAVDRGLELDGRYAHLHYLRGLVLDALGRPAEARPAYERARDEDVCPLRALGPMAGIVAEVARERGVPVVDFEALVESLAPDAIPGEETFVDHVHPTIEGNRRLALALLDEMIGEGLVRPAPTWGEASIRQVIAQVESGLDPVAHGQALANLSKVLGWAGKLEEAHKLAAQAVELAPQSPAVHHQAALAAHLTGALDDAVRHYRRTIELAPATATAHSNLAVILDEAGQDAEAAVHYRRAIALLDDNNAAYRGRLREALAKIE